MNRVPLIAFLALAASFGAAHSSLPFPAMQSTSYVITSCEFNSFGKYKASSSYDTWDSGGQPSFIGAWPKGVATGGTSSGLGWAYTINLPIFWDKDHDRDGMIQAFEDQFHNAIGLSDSDASDAYGDPDEDGFTNIQEYLSRTNPDDQNSFFQFTDIRIATDQGEPALYWNAPTIRITGFESEYPQYARSLRFDVLYADWPKASQENGNFPNQDWFNQTGTWKILGVGSGLSRDPNSTVTSFTATTVSLSSLQDGDIRFFRLAVGGTAFEGEPVSGLYSYTAVGDPRIASTVAKEILMVQKHTLNSSEYPVFGLAGDTTGGGDGKLKYSLGTSFLPAGSTMGDATNINFWVPSGGTGNPNDSSVDFLQTGGNWMAQDDGETPPSTRKIVPEEGFRLAYKAGLPSSKSLYLGSQLKMDSYYHDIYRRVWNGQTSGPDDEANAQITFLSYNFPLGVPFKELAEADPPDFPPLAGTAAPLFPLWAGLQSDWVILYDRTFNYTVEGEVLTFGSQNVIIYFNHSEGRWEYFAPMDLITYPVLSELIVSPGSPIIVYQYWNPRDPLGTDSFLMEADVPYQSGGAASIKTYLKFAD